MKMKITLDIHKYVYSYLEIFVQVKIMEFYWFTVAFIHECILLVMSPAVISSLSIITLSSSYSCKSFLWSTFYCLFFIPLIIWRFNFPTNHRLWRFSQSNRNRKIKRIRTKRSLKYDYLHVSYLCLVENYTNKYNYFKL